MASTTSFSFICLMVAVGAGVQACPECHQPGLLLQRVRPGPLGVAMPPGPPEIEVSEDLTLDVLEAPAKLYAANDEAPAKLYAANDGTPAKLVKDELVKDDLVKDLVKDDLVKDLVKDDLVKDLVKEDLVKDDLVKDELVKDLVKDDTLTKLLADDDTLAKLSADDETLAKLREALRRLYAAQVISTPARSAGVEEAPLGTPRFIPPGKLHRRMLIV